MKPTKEKKWLYILVSIFIATSVWMYVRAGEDPEMENRVRGIPVTTVGDRVLENQRLMIDAISHKTVSLTWKGSWRDIGSLDKKNVSVSVDVSRITQPGTYELDYTINYPPHVATSAISLQGGQPQKISVTVSEIYSQTFHIQPVFKGSIADGYKAGEFIVEPETVQISGVRQKVNSIDSVQVVLERKDMKESFAGDLPLRVLDQTGKEMDLAGLRLSADNIYAVLPVVVVKDIPLVVDFVDGGGATRENIEYEIEPKTITVSGLEKDMQHLEKISLGSIDLAQVLDTATETFPIFLPAELENVSGLTSANVKVTIKDLATRAFEVSDISWSNVPGGYKATLTTRVCTVVLRGTPKELEKVSDNQIRIVVDWSNLSTATGSYNVPAKVYLYTDAKVGVIGQNNVVVNLSKN